MPPPDHDADWMDDWSRVPNDDIAAGWIRYQANRPSQPSGDEADGWAVEAMIQLSDVDPSRALEIAFLISRRSDQPAVLEMLGASALEDLLSEDPTLLDAIAIEVGVNENLRIALKSVWKSTMSDDAWDRLQRLATG